MTMRQTSWAVRLWVTAVLVTAACSGGADGGDTGDSGGAGDTGDSGDSGDPGDSGTPAEICPGATRRSLSFAAPAVLPARGDLPLPDVPSFAEVVAAGDGFE